MHINSKAVYHVSGLREETAVRSLWFARNSKIRNPMIIASELEMVKNVSVETQK